MRNEFESLMYGPEVPPTPSTVFQGDFQDLNPDEQLHVAAQLIESNRLYVSQHDLVRRIKDGNRLLVRFDRAEAGGARLLACTGYKRALPEIRERLREAPGAAWEVDLARVDRFLYAVGKGTAMEKSWSFNSGDKDVFRGMVRQVLRELDCRGPYSTFALVREGNDRARAHITGYGFECFGRVPSPWSSNVLFVYVRTSLE